MADNNIKVNLEVSSNGTTDKELSKSEKLRKSLEGAAAAMGKTGGTAGSRAVAASYTPAMTGQEYGQARGSTGATGASARDFANQAQGLGGLVRLYATYAANLFAVAAAFNALREAMNTTNMVEGLNQLGAASGVAMGNLAKQFTAASGGAISLRESMEATAKAVSSGLSQTQFLQLGEVAKKASQALGINMSDAVSRLTRGITKLEPELLDELGIFTKVGKATEDYARKVGKAESALTDFERRQAFANAVLEEGSKKFGEIDIPTNPYDKLLASLKNTGQQILEVVNVALVPLINALSSSPTALLGVIGLVGAKIVSQALPAIAQYREELQKAADLDLKRAQSRSRAAEIAAEAAKKANAVEIQAEKERIAELRTTQVDAAEAQLKAVSKKGLSKSVREILATEDLQSITKQQLDTLDKLGSKTTKVSAAYRELSLAIKNAQKANNDYLESEKQLKQREKEAPGLLSAASSAARREQSAARRAASSAIIRDVVQLTDEEGARSAFKKLGESLDTKKLGVARTAFTALAGTVSIVTTKVIGLAAAFGNVFAVLGIIITAYQMFTGFFGKNAKELEASKAALDTLEGSIDSVSRTIERQNKLPILETLTPDNIAAKSTAFATLGESLLQSIDAVDKEIRNRNWVDSVANLISGIVGDNTEERLAKGLSDGIESAFKSATSASQGDNLRKYLALTLSLPADATIGEIQKATKKASPALQREVAGVIEKIGKEAQRANGSIKAFVDSLASSGKLYQDLINSFKPGDPLSRFASDSSTKLAEFSKVLDSSDLVGKLSLLNATANDTRFLQLLPLDAATQILNTRTELQNLTNDLAQSNDTLRQLEQGRQQAQERLDQTARGRVEYKQLQEAIKLYDELIKKQRESTIKLEKDLDPKLQSVSQNFNEAIRLGMLENIARFEKGITNAARNAQLDLQGALTGGLADPEARAREEGRIAQERIKIEMETVRSQASLIESNERLRLAILENSYGRALEQAKRDLGVRTEGEALSSDSKLAAQFRELQLGREFSKMDLAGLRKVLQSVTGGTDQSVVGAASAALPRAEQQAGVAAKQRELVGKQQTQAVKTQQDIISAVADKQAKSLQESVQYNEKLLESYKAAAWFKGMELSEQQQILEAIYQANSAAQIQLATAQERKAVTMSEYLLEQARKTGSLESISAAETSLKYAKERLSVAQRTAEQEASNAKTARNILNTQALAAEQFAKDAQNRTQVIELAKIEETTVSGLQQARREELQIMLDRGQISQDAYNAEIIGAEKASLVRQNSIRLLELENQYLAEKNTLQKQIDNTAATLAERELARQGLANLEQRYKLQREGTLSVFQAQNKLLDQQASLTDRQRAYSDIFKNSFNSMADAIVQWAETGKLSGKDLFNSLIADLARYELRLQMTQLYSSAIRPGLVQGLTAIFGGSAANTNVPFSTAQAGYANTGPMGLVYAKGAAFDYSMPVQEFAKGGTFTNSIVNSPTLFKFARGTGLMGEAGPEAIMPLKRDASGNLGVRADSGGGKVDVVVNNYTGASAETRETVDSRGNRKIEVIVGDMAAVSTVAFSMLEAPRVRR